MKDSPLLPTTAITPADPCDGLVQLERALSGNPHAVGWLLKEIQRWVRAAAQGDVPALQHFLRMPTTARRLRRHARNLWMREAAQHVEGAGIWTKAEALHRELVRFRACAAWASSLDDTAPPSELGSELRPALWWILKFSGGRVIKARRIADIIHQL